MDSLKRRYFSQLGSPNGTFTKIKTTKILEITLFDRRAILDPYHPSLFHFFLNGFKLISRMIILAAKITDKTQVCKILNWRKRSSCLVPEVCFDEVVYVLLFITEFQFKERLQQSTRAETLALTVKLLLGNFVSTSLAMTVLVLCSEHHYNSSRISRIATELGPGLKSRGRKVKHLSGKVDENIVKSICRT